MTVMRIYHSNVKPTNFENTFQMSEINEAKYGHEFDGDVAAYVLQNIDFEEYGLKLCVDDNLGDIQQNFGPYEPKNICVLRRVIDDMPDEVWFAAEAIDESDE